MIYKNGKILLAIGIINLIKIFTFNKYLLNESEIIKIGLSSKKRGFPHLLRCATAQKVREREISFVLQIYAMFLQEGQLYNWYVKNTFV